MANTRTVSRGRAIDLLTPEDCRSLGDGKHFDGAGLTLIVRGESRAFVFRYTAPNGSRREKGLGKVDRAKPNQPQTDLKKVEASLARARRLAAAIRDKVLLGLDPLAEEAALRQAAASDRVRQQTAQMAVQATLRRVLRDYHAKHVEPVLTAKHSSQWINSVERHIPTKLLDKPIAMIEASELLDALQPLYIQVPETARRVRQRLDTVFDHAVLRKLAPGNPAKIIVRALRQKREKGNFRALPFAEVSELVARLCELPATSARALEFAILTAARTSEVLNMEWSELSPDGEVWTVPASRMKAGEAHTVYLSKSARGILAVIRGMSDRWVFCSPTGDRPMSNMAMLLLLRRLKVNQLTTVHGLCRATFSTWANETNAARREVIEACLAHRESDAVRAAYNRAQFADERRALLAAWGKYVMSATAQTSSQSTKARLSRAKLVAAKLPLARRG